MPRTVQQTTRAPASAAVISLLSSKLPWGRRQGRHRNNHTTRCFSVRHAHQYLTKERSTTLCYPGGCISQHYSNLVAHTRTTFRLSTLTLALNLVPTRSQSDIRNNAHTCAWQLRSHLLSPLYRPRMPLQTAGGEV